MPNENPSEVIDFFGPDTPYFFLSNFYPSPLRLWNVSFRTVEHPFAYRKLSLEDTKENNEWRERIRNAKTPNDAKQLGRRCPLREDWEEIKIPLMHELVLEKFTQNSGLGQQLIDTGTAYLQEGTYWNDRVWGVDLKHKGEWRTRPGRNLLGKTLMNVRGILVSAK